MNIKGGQNRPDLRSEPGGERRSFKNLGGGGANDGRNRRRLNHVGGPEDIVPRPPAPEIRRGKAFAREKKNRSKNPPALECATGRPQNAACFGGALQHSNPHSTRMSAEKKPAPDAKKIRPGRQDWIRISLTATPTNKRSNPVCARRATHWMCSGTCS